MLGVFCSQIWTCSKGRSAEIDDKINPFFLVNCPGIKSPSGNILKNKTQEIETHVASTVDGQKKKKNHKGYELYMDIKVVRK